MRHESPGLLLGGGACKDILVGLIDPCGEFKQEDLAPREHFVGYGQGFSRQTVPVVMPHLGYEVIKLVI